MSDSILTTDDKLAACIKHVFTCDYSCVRRLWSGERGAKIKEFRKYVFFHYPDIEREGIERVLQRLVDASIVKIIKGNSRGERGPGGRHIIPLKHPYWDLI